MGEVVKEIRDILSKQKDIKYTFMQENIVPNISKETIIGVRVPFLRQMAKEYVKRPDIDGFLQDLPHKYFDENNFHSCLIDAMKDFDTCVRELERFLPFIDNWATSDYISPKIFKKHKEELLPFLYKWVEREETYHKRVAIKLWMDFYLDEDFRVEYPKKIAAIRSSEYYVNMMVAWYFATALAKQWDTVIPFLEKKALPKWTHNKTIQKARESYRITKEQKEYLMSLKWK